MNVVCITAKMSLLFLVVVAGALACCATNRVTPVYNLYSWENPRGVWNFCLLSGLISRRMTPEEVRNEKTVLHGLNQLKQAMSRLEKSSSIVWFDRGYFTGLKGSEAFQYPPKEIVHDLRTYAGTHGIEIVLYAEILRQAPR